MMQLGCDGVFVGSGIFKSGDPKKSRSNCNCNNKLQRSRKTHEVSKNLGEPMVGINIDDLDEAEKLAKEVGNENWCFSTSRFFYDHVQSLELIDQDYVLIKDTSDLSNVNSLILPGGESTSMIKFKKTMIYFLD